MSYHLLETATLSSASSYTYSNFNETSSSTVGPYWAWEIRLQDLRRSSSSDYYPQLQANASLNIPYVTALNSFTEVSPTTNNRSGSSWIQLTERACSWQGPWNGKLLIEQPKRNGTTWYCNFIFDFTSWVFSTYKHQRSVTTGVFTSYTSIDQITLRPSNGVWNGSVAVYGIVS